jgi:predicted dehydrogenase
MERVCLITGGAGFLGRKYCEFFLNKHSIFLIEKPLGLCVEEAIYLSNLAKKRSSKVFVGLNRRSYSSTRQVLEGLSMDDGIRVIQVSDQEDTNIELENGKPIKLIESWMYANSIHLIDYFNIFARGKLTNVERIFPWHGLDTNFICAKLEFSSGDIGIYQAFWNFPGPWGVSISTNSMRWEMRPLESLSINYGMDRQTISASIDNWDSQFKAGLRFQAEELVKTLSSGSSKYLATIEDGLNAMKLVNLIYEK